MNEKAVLRRAHDDYLRLCMAGDSRWPELERVAVGVDDSRTLAADRTGYDAVLDALAGNDGWARFRSGVSWTGREDQPDHEILGSPLYAEWCEDSTRSVRLRLNPDNPEELKMWTFTEQVLTREEEPKLGQDLYLREQVVVLGHRRRIPDRTLVYHVFWGVDTAGGVRRIFDRFAGFGEGVKR